MFNLTSLAKIQKENLFVIHGVTRNVIKQKLKQYRKQKEMDDTNNNNDTSGNYNADVSFSKRKAFLDYLIEISENGSYKFSERNLQDEVDTMMIAGNDTTASVNSYILLMLRIHQDIQQKVYRELFEIFGESDRPCARDDIKEMPHLEMVIKETIRMFPPGPIIMRYVTNDLQIEKYTLPADTGCIIAIAKTHRLPDIWSNPNKFDPDRFLPEEVAKRHPYALIPFSGGPRNCIGGRYAFISMKCVLSTILRKYRIYSDLDINSLELELDFFLKPIEGYRIRIEKRDASSV